MVAAGFGCTLVPALAVRAGELAGRGIQARPLRLAAAARPVALWYRCSFPQPRLLEALADVVVAALPASVTPRRQAVAASSVTE